MNYFGYGYHCEVNNLEVFENSSFFDRAIGFHKDEKSNEDVVWILIFKVTEGQGKMLGFPGGLKNIFPNLNAISIMNMELKEISTEDLKPFPNLKHLVLFKNNLTIIDEDLFQFTPHLESLSFSLNHMLSHIDPLTLSGLKNLNWLKLRKLSCKIENDDSLIRTSVNDLIKKIEAEACVDYGLKIRKLNEEIQVWKGKYGKCQSKYDKCMEEVSEKFNEI